MSSCLDSRGGFDSSADSSVSFLSHVDCSAIDELDPSLGEAVYHCMQFPSCTLELCAPRSTQQLSFLKVATLGACAYAKVLTGQQFWLVLVYETLAVGIPPSFVLGLSLAAQPVDLSKLAKLAASRAVSLSTRA